MWWRKGGFKWWKILFDVITPCKRSSWNWCNMCMWVWWLHVVYNDPTCNVELSLLLVVLNKCIIMKEPHSWKMLCINGFKCMIQLHCLKILLVLGQELHGWELNLKLPLYWMTNILVLPFLAKFIHRKHVIVNHVLIPHNHLHTIYSRSSFNYKSFMFKINLCTLTNNYFQTCYISNKHGFSWGF